MQAITCSFISSAIRKCLLHFSQTQSMQKSSLPGIPTGGLISHLPRDMALQFCSQSISLFVILIENSLQKLQTLHCITKQIKETDRNRSFGSIMLLLCGIHQQKIFSYDPYQVTDAQEDVCFILFTCKIKVHFHQLVVFWFFGSMSQKGKRTYCDSL